MIEATFYGDEDLLEGFLIRGHSGYSEEGSDIICASVSSAAYMAANTLTEIASVKADISVKDGYLRLMTKDTSREAQTILRGLKLHISTLAEDYSEYILCNEKTL